MQTSNAFFVLAAAVTLSLALMSGAGAQSRPTEQEIIDALLAPPVNVQDPSRTRSMTRGRGVTVSGGDKAAPSIALRVNFAFDSARLDNESMLTLDVLGRALSSDRLKGQAIEIIGHTDAKGTMAYNDALSQRRAAAVVSYIVGHFAVDGLHISSKGMGERQLLEEDNPEAAVNRRVEIRNVTHTR